MPSREAGKTFARLNRFYPRSDQSSFENLRRAVAGFATRQRSGRPLSRRWLLSRDWRRALGPLAPHGGSSWWALTADACRYIDAFVQRQPRAIRFLQNTRSPDEVVFQTIIANSPYAPRIRRSLMFTDWSARKAHPAAITEPHVTRFAEPGPLVSDGVYGRGEMCFARKFPDDGGRMVALVDAMIRAREAAGG